MSVLCGCFGTSSIGNDARTRNIQGRANRIHNDPKSSSSKAWDDFKSHATKQKSILILGMEGSGKTTIINQLIDKKLMALPAPPSKVMVEQQYFSPAPSIPTSLPPSLPPSLFLPPPSSIMEQYRIVLNDTTPILLIDVPPSADMMLNVRSPVMAGLFALIYVVDWADELRRCVAIEHLANLFFSNDLVRQVPLLVVVNKVETADPMLGHASIPSNFLATSINGDAATLAASSSDPFHLVPSTTPEFAASVLGMSIVPHARMRVVCCSAAYGWGINDIAAWLNDTCNTDTTLSSSQAVHDQSILW